MRFARKYARFRPKKAWENGEVSGVIRAEHLYGVRPKIRVDLEKNLSIKYAWLGEIIWIELLWIDFIILVNLYHIFDQMIYFQIIYNTIHWIKHKYQLHIFLQNQWVRVSNLCKSIFTQM